MNYHQDATDDAKWTRHAAEQMAQEAFKPWRGDRLYQAVMAAGPISRLLDFGCGTGLWVPYWQSSPLSEIPGSYIGVDRNPDMIAGARKRWKDNPWPTFFLCDVLSGQHLPFDDGTFDVTVTVAVLQHNSDSEKEIVLSEIRRILRTNGRHCCYEDTYGAWNPTPGHQEEIEDGFCHSQKGWREVFEPHGFEAVLQDKDLHVFRAI